MAIDTDTEQSPGWWLKILATELHNRRVGRSGRRRWTRDQVESAAIRPGLDLLEQYRRGDPPLREDIHSDWAAPFRRYVRMGRLNFAGKLVRPTANRMGLRGFRTAASDDEFGDKEAHKLMRVNRLKLVARDVTDDMLSYADGYALVTPPGSEGGTALITSQSPMQCITAHDAATGRTLAGLNMFRDEWDSSDWGYVYILDKEHAGKPRLHVASRTGPTTLGRRGLYRLGEKSWEWVPEKEREIPGTRIPLVRFRNERGVGEFEEHLDHLDRINDKIFNEWWTEKIQAFRQRAIQRDRADLEDGYDDDVQDAEDERSPDPLHPGMSPQEIADMFVSSPDALWDLPPGAKMWESQPIDVRGQLESIQKELQWLAAAADKPLSSLTPDAVNQSAEGSNNQKEEHTFLVGDRRDRAEGSWAEVISLAFEYQGDKARSDVSQIDTLWGPLEIYSLEQRSQAASQANTSLPREAIQRDIWQYDPAEIPELRKMDGRDLLFQQPGQPPRSGTRS